jgi:hypothetical protein
MQPPTLVQAGQRTLQPSNRAGDFSGLSVDPTAGSSFWAANEYATTASSNNWGTAIANFSISGASTLAALTPAPARGGGEAEGAPIDSWLADPGLLGPLGAGRRHHRPIDG